MAAFSARWKPPSARWRCCDVRSPTRPRCAWYRVELPRLAAGGGVSHDAQQPRPGGCRAPRRPGGLRRHRPCGAQLGCLRCDGAHAHHLESRRDDARAVGQARRGVPHPRVGTARAAGQQQPGARVGQLGRVPPLGGHGPHHVRPDDRRVVDLHRHPGHPARHLRVLRRDRPPQVPPVSVAWVARSRWQSP